MLYLYYKKKTGGDFLAVFFFALDPPSHGLLQVATAQPISPNQLILTDVAHVQSAQDQIK
jgi:hypothetical protein